MAKRIGFLCLAITLLLTGCRSGTGSENSFPVVQQITVTCEHNGYLTRRIYTTEAKMRQILNSLRSVGQKSKPPIDPDKISTRTYSIIMTYTNNTQRLYQLKADRYIRICREPWQQVDPKQVSELHLLLQNLPSDEPSVERRLDIPRHLEI